MRVWLTGLYKEYMAHPTYRQGGGGPAAGQGADGGGGPPGRPPAGAGQQGGRRPPAERRPGRQGRGAGVPARGAADQDRRAGGGELFFYKFLRFSSTDIQFNLLLPIYLSIFTDSVLWIRNYFFRIRIRIRLFRKFRIRPNLSAKRQNQNFKLKLQHWLILILKKRFFKSNCEFYFPYS